MKNFLFILGTELYTEEQIRNASEIAQTGGYTEIFIPTPDGKELFRGRAAHSPPFTTFRCETMIVPAKIFVNIKDFHFSSKNDIIVTFCDLIDTLRCTLNYYAARDAGFHSEVLRLGKLIRRFVPAYEYPMR